MEDHFPVSTQTNFWDVVFLLLKFGIKSFEDDRNYKNLSPKTIAAYLLTLNEFHEFCVKQEILNAEEVTSAVIKSYLMYCQKERDNNPTTRNSKLHTLKIFFNYLEAEEIITSKKNPTKRMAYVKEEIKIEVFSDQQIKQMLGYLRRVREQERTFNAYRDYTIIVTMLGTGIRLGELCNLKWDDVSFKFQTITVWGKKREQSSIPLTDKLVKELAEYRMYCEQNFSELSEYVFTDKRKNGRLSEEAVKSIFKRLKKIMNFTSTRLSAHTLRHTFAHRMVMSGCDVFTLQKMLRHSQLSMTQRYLALWGTALAEQNNRYNPLNNMDI